MRSLQRPARCLLLRLQIGVPSLAKREFFGDAAAKEIYDEALERVQNWAPPWS